MSVKEEGIESIIVGIAGGSGSGKTTLAREITRRLGNDQITVIRHDSYYLDHGHVTLAERANINYDHPDVLETTLLVKHLKALRCGQPVKIPIYDFTTHTRKSAAETIYPKKIIIVEGILIFADEALRRQMDIKVFVDTGAYIRFIRRLQRDIGERGRTWGSVIRQYLSTVRPMHLEFVEPSKKYADVIVTKGGYDQKTVDELISRIKSIKQRSKLER